MKRLLRNKLVTMTIALLLVPCLANAYGINFDSMTEDTAVSSVSSGGVTVTMSSTSVNPLYVGKIDATTSEATTSGVRYLTTGVNDPDWGFYQSPFLQGGVIRLDFSVEITSLSANFIITANGPATPFAISDIAAGGSVNTSSFATLGVMNDYWSVGFNSSTPFTTAYLISSIVPDLSDPASDTLITISFLH
jgi:hypothetical protein